MRTIRGQQRTKTKDNCSLIAIYGERLAKQEGSWRCHYCHIPVKRAPFDWRKKLKAQGREIATVDHKQALANGGSESLDNYVLCCWGCNQEKAQMGYVKYCIKTAKQREDRQAKHINKRTIS